VVVKFTKFYSNDFLGKGGETMKKWMALAMIALLGGAMMLSACTPQQENASAPAEETGMTEQPAAEQVTPEAGMGEQGAAEQGAAEQATSGE
jgi:uncharacterized lipoprotein YbaY